jgi:hypothetical protein
MSRFTKITAAAGMLLWSAQAEAADWQLQPAETGRNAVLTYAAGDPVSYRFECTAKEVVATETGVTKLLDLRTGKPVDDGPNAIMPEGAAMMALFGGKGDPQFQPAEAVKNPAGGWDLTIRLAKNDKQLKAVGKSDMMSLFTTGFTMAVPMNDSARGLWNDFVRGCQARS